MIPRLAIATKNADKRREMAQLLVASGLVGEVVEGLDWPDVEETGSSLTENALLKASAVVEATGLPAIGDDTGLEVAALGGAPGVFSARFAGPDASYDDNVDFLLNQLDGVADRTARFRTVLALVLPDGSELVVEGMLAGSITTDRRGIQGFGYDPVFEVEGRTLGEMSAGEKNAVSHRARAVEALILALSD